MPTRQLPLPVAYGMTLEERVRRLEEQLMRTGGDFLVASLVGGDEGDGVGGGGGGSLTTGTTTVDFGAFPGASDASVAVTGQAGIVSSSEVHAWLIATATADHTADEHWVEAMQITAGNIVAGVGFTIYARAFGDLPESLPGQSGFSRTQLAVVHGVSTPSGRGGALPRRYGQWTVGWAWQ